MMMPKSLESLAQRRIPMELLAGVQVSTKSVERQAEQIGAEIMRIEQAEIQSSMLAVPELAPWLSIFLLLASAAALRFHRRLAPWVLGAAFRRPTRLAGGIRFGPVPISAVISFYGPSDLDRGYRELPSPYPIDARRVLETFLGGSPSQMPGNYRTASPATYANRPVPPTLLIQGARDHIVKPEFARALQQQLTASGNQAVTRGRRHYRKPYTSTSPLAGT